MAITLNTGIYIQKPDKTHNMQKQLESSFFSDSKLEDRRMSKIGNCIKLTKGEQFVQRINCE